MGYTRYWDRTEKPITRQFVEEVKKVFDECKAKGITLKDGWGENEPIVTDELIDFNGDASQELDCENFLMTNEDRGFNFCKTREYPYDYAVEEILKIAEEMKLVKNVSNDGEVIHTNDKGEEI